MNEEIENESGLTTKKNSYVLPISILVSALIIAGALSGTAKEKSREKSVESKPYDGENFSVSELSKGAITLPVIWGNLGAEIANAGVIDEEKFESIYASKGKLKGRLPDGYEELLNGTEDGYLKISENNAGLVLNLLWALGLGTKNEILEKGPMRDPKYGGAGNFASTGGWTIAKGNAMEHYSRHPFMVLDDEEQKMVERVASNIYRPCCNNSTHFPDCNHGMAMLGFLELMASQGFSEEEMYENALLLNSYWFPDTYLNIEKYFSLNGLDYEKANPKEILGSDYSSGTGYRRVLSGITKPASNAGGSCGV